MGTVIAGTENYTGGSYSIPSETDNGKVAAGIIEDFMTRMAKHVHDNQDAATQAFSAHRVEYNPLVWNPAPDDTIVKDGYVTEVTIGAGLTYLQAGLPATYLLYAWDGAKYVPVMLDHTQGTLATQIKIYSNHQFTKLVLVRL